MTLRLYAAVGALGALLVVGGACGNGNRVIASCNLTASSLCRDYTGSLYSTNSVQGICNVIAGATYSPDPCGLANRVGSCTVSTGATAEFIIRYYSTGTIPYTSDTAQSHCGTQDSPTFVSDTAAPAEAEPEPTPEATFTL